MSQLTKLKSAQSRKELAQILGYKPKSLTSIVYKTSNAAKYTVFDIEKKSGGKRTIKAPIPKLKKLQSHLAHVLYQCLNEIEQEKGLKPISFGFRMNRSIADNAAIHKRRRWVLNIDLADFFPSFNFGRVRGFFLKDKAFELNDEVATTIAQIACDGTALPQGSPCSPVISELIAQILDMRLVRLAKKYRVTYSRYADDITFSTNQKEFPSGIASADNADSSIWHLSNELVSKITGGGFAINPAKTRMHFRGSRQMVNGLVVNEKVNIRSDYYRRARAMCHQLFQTGSYFTSTLPSANTDEEPKPDWTSSLNPLEGVLSFIYTITQTEERREITEQRHKPRAIRKLYRRFLFYRKFLALDAPLIITEGKTDPVYLKEAIARRAKFHPVLGEPKEDGFKHAVNYLNYEGQVHEIMDLGGGTGDLKSIPLDYIRNLEPKKMSIKYKPIAHKPLKHPVIILLDNDDGLTPVASTLKKNFDVSINLKSTCDFYHIAYNLYLVKTPEKDGRNTCIEDLFTKEWQDHKLNGKTFKPEKKTKKDKENSPFDPTKHYSKQVFAKSVIKPNANKIDFSGFDPLLERIVKVIDNYSL